MKRIFVFVSILCMMFSITGFADESEAFSSGDFEYTLREDGTAEITKYTGEASEIEVPAELDGYLVTRIGENAFSFSVDENKTITSITLPESVTSIEEDAFLWCKSLPSITLPESITSIEGNPFTKCNDIQFDISPDHPYLEVIDGALFSKPDKRLICCPGRMENYVVPEGTTCIAEEAFFGSENLKSVTLPESVTSIGDSAFYGCYGLTDINLPKSLTSIGDLAFSDCDSLENINLPESLTSIGNSAFSDCDSVTSIIIPEGMTSVADYAFSRCFNLTDITLPESITSIGEFSFAKCDPVEIILPEGLVSIGKRAFVECENLEKINLPESLTSIGEKAFLDCNSLDSIFLPKSMTSIGEEAFSDCDSLTITVQRDSYAAEYCKENDLKYTFTDTNSEDTGSIGLSGKDAEEDGSDELRSDSSVVEGKYYGMCGYYDEMYLDIIPEDASKTRGKCIKFDVFSQEFTYTIDGNILSVKDNLDYEIYKDYLIPHEHDYSGIIPDEDYFDIVVKRETEFSTEEIRFSKDGKYVSTYKSSSSDSVETGTYEREGELIKFIGDESYNVKYGNIEYGIVKDGILNQSASVFRKENNNNVGGYDDISELDGSWDLVGLLMDEDILTSSELGLSGKAVISSQNCSITVEGIDTAIEGKLSPSDKEDIYYIMDGQNKLAICTLSNKTLMVLIGSASTTYTLLFEKATLGDNGAASENNSVSV